jgi:hypothetical protein
MRDQIETIYYLKSNNAENFEDCTLNDYTIYYACLNQHNKFVAHCANEKIKFPQVALYCQLAANNLAMCNICLSAGCKIDENCMTIACALFEKDIIEYCMKFGIKPQESDYLLLLKLDDTYHFHYNELTTVDNVNELTFKNNLLIFISKGKLYRNFYYCNGGVDQCTLTLWWKKKYNPNDLFYRKSRCSHIFNNMNKSRAECFNFMKNSGIDIPHNILKLCVDYEIKLDDKNMSG